MGGEGVSYRDSQVSIKMILTTHQSEGREFKPPKHNMFAPVKILQGLFLD